MTYAVGTKVWDDLKKKYGCVVSVWHDGSGPRYLIQHSGWHWSVPGWAVKKSRSHF